MSTLTEIETAVPNLGLHELSRLEQFVRSVRLERQRHDGLSALDLPPLQLGAILTPLGPETDLLEEMLDDARD